MTLKLVGTFGVAVCPTCNGRRTVKCEKTFHVRAGLDGCNARGPMLTPSSGKKIPCPTCRGKGVVSA